MTMLDRMRRHRNWLKWSLGLVCLAFVIFYIPDFLRSTTDAAAGDTVAIVEGHEIRGEEFRRTYQAQLQSYRAAYGGRMSDSLLKQLGIDQQILQQMVDERAAIAEADRLGIAVSDQEVAQRIYAIPAFQENGQFIGTARYQQVLAAQRPPLTTTEFEGNVRRSLALDKLRASITEWLSVSDKDVETAYRSRNDKVKLAIVTFNTDSYRSNITASDAEVGAYFAAHTADFRIPEKRRVRYLLIDVEALRAKVTVSPSEIERAYNESIEQYTTPEQVRASHILLKTDGKDDAAVKATAEDVLKQIRAGADFATLAKKYSQDDANAKNGGDLDYFGRGRMVPEFDTAAFALESGQTSDLVKTEYGFHIIKLTDKKPSATRKLDEVRQEITERLSYERAQVQAATLAETLQEQIKKPADLDAQAKTHGLTVVETGFFAASEPILGVGSAPEMTARAFSLNPGEVSGALRTSRGFVFETLVEKKDAYIPGIDEVKDRVRDELIRTRAREMAKAKALEFAARVKSPADFERVAKAGNIDVKTTELLTRESPRTDLGAGAEVIDAAFKLAPGALSEPIVTETSTSIVKLVEKVQATPEELASSRENFRAELLADRRNRFFGSYMAKAKQKMKISVNREALKRVVG
jgi:peptidyl-prolyl cis-trans isomerase D